MTAVYKSSNKNFVRLGVALSLIFFVPLLFYRCTVKEKAAASIIWSGRQAVGISIPTSHLEEYDDALFKTELQIRLAKSDVAMLGEYEISNSQVMFKSLIPLSPGSKYEVFYKGSLISRLSIPLPDKNDAPSLIAIYPSADTLPENLLKIYLQFSSPMREGEALLHIHLLNAYGDTIPDIFLDLQPELWNEERTTLTVWLDPGRIKRDLIPNRQLGNPLQKGKSYTLHIDDKWKDAQGLLLKQSYTKHFVVTERDSKTPDPGHWKISLPFAGTDQPLQIQFNESLDYFLLLETIRIVTDEGDNVKGNIRIGKKEGAVEFFPKELWKTGRYRLKIASYLEDLAGNNLTRPFDRDIKLQPRKEGEFVEREFTIQ